jgi:putative serine protease PepD
MHDDRTDPDYGFPEPAAGAPIEPASQPGVSYVPSPASPPVERPVEQPAERRAEQPAVSAPPQPAWPMASADEPLHVCDYTGESEEPCEEPATQKRWSGAAVVIAAALGSLVGGVLVAAGLVWALGLLPGTEPLRSKPASNSGVTQATSLTINAAANNPDVAEAVAQKVVPSVVNVTIQGQQTDPFTGQTSMSDLGNGSGVIIRPDGYILTNYHVIEGADRVLVSVGVGNKEAKVVGADKSTDLAVLKIDGTGYPAIDLGTSSDLKVGQFVMAVGSPFGLEKTVTSGIISALQRTEQVQQSSNDLTTYTNLIQTDAAINPGNSGGALVDESGRLVGINTLIQSPSGGVGAAQSAGIGFALPVDFAKSIAEQLISTGKASHPYLGVSTQTIDKDIAAQYGLPVEAGAIVAFDEPNGPGETAGIKRGDIIVKIGDQDVSSVADVFSAVRQHNIGDSVKVEFVRNDVKKTVSVKLGSDAAAQ